jgi:hypothetical protein
MGWFKKIITIVLIIPRLVLLVVSKMPLLIVIPLLGWLSSGTKKSATPSAAGNGANEEEIAAMKKLEEDAMSDEEKQAKAKNDLKLVINGAKIQCTMCSNPMGTLIATHNTPSIQGQPAAIATDKEKMNLIFAGNCLKLPNTPTPCMTIIQPGQWQDTGSFKMQDESPLLLKSTIKCLFGGVDIKITDCGQRSIFAYDSPTEMENDTDETSQMRIALFFDGTRNNMKNTEAREEYFKLHKKRPYKDDLVAQKNADRVKAAHYVNNGNKKDDSYENGYSNVALLYQYFMVETENSENLKDCIYVEGIATGDYEHDAYVEDTFGGYVLAMGETGIIAKVEKGCSLAAEKIFDLCGKSKTLEQITIDVIGFSRGAAAARHFLHELSKSPRPAYEQIVPGSSTGYSSTFYTVPATPRYGKFGLELEKKGVDISSCHIVIRFAGLYDTVASHGISFNKKGNTKTLGLDAIRLAKNTLHLAAADEHRYFFPLVNINSVGFKEKTFPGVHSDIGGSYVNDDPEFKKALAIGVNYFVDEKYKKVIREGWYKKDQLNIIRPSILNAALFAATLGASSLFKDYASLGRLTGSKERISVAYSYIFLHIMCKYAMEEKGIYLKFKKGELESKYNLDEHCDLEDISARLNAIVFDDAPEMTFYTRTELEEEIDKIRPGGKLIKNEEWLWDAEDTIRLEWEAGRPIELEAFITDSVLKQKIEDHNTLLWLRNKYLHWSADWFEPGFNLTANGKRTIHPG